MITISAVQLLIIIIYHIITNVRGGVIMHTNIINTIRWITRQHNIPQNNCHELKNTPPDKTYNYLEYQEPLIGEN